MPSNDARERAATADRFASVLAAVILVAAGVALALLAVRLAAVASGSPYSPWGKFGVPVDHGGRIGLLLLAFVVSLLVLAVGLRQRDPVLRFASEEGDVVVRAGALEQLVRAELAAHPDVLRVAPRVRLRRGRLAAEVEIIARPLADATTLRGIGERAVRSALCDTAGLPPATSAVSVDVVSIRRLRMYLR